MPTLSFYLLLEYKATGFIIEILRKMSFKKLKNFIIYVFFRALILSRQIKVTAAIIH